MSTTLADIGLVDWANTVIGLVGLGAAGFALLQTRRSGTPRSHGSHPRPPRAAASGLPTSTSVAGRSPWAWCFAYSRTT